MSKQLRLGLFLGFAGILMVCPALAVVIDFTGGSVTRLSPPSPTTTNNLAVWDHVDFYVENGFRLDFVGNTSPWSSFIGDYYHVGNDVIHGHWLGGGPTFSDLLKIEITKMGGGPFDLNYFILTSNTHNGPPGSATGTEQTYIKAIGGASPGYTQLLPPETWGFPATQVFLGPQFDGVTAVEFYTTNFVECFGMDEFYIDQAPPPSKQVPESASTLALIGLALGGLALASRRMR